MLCSVHGEISEYTIHEAELFGLPIQTLAADDIFSRTDIIKITLCGEAEALRQRAENLRPQLPAKVSAFFTDQHYFEMVPASVSKGSTLQILTERGILRPGTIMAIGDQENDLFICRSGSARGNGQCRTGAEAGRGYITADCGRMALLPHFIITERHSATTHNALILFMFTSVMRTVMNPIKRKEYILDLLNQQGKSVCRILLIH